MIGHHLHDLLRIAALTPSQWLAELDKLPADARAEIEPWLRMQAAILRSKRRTSPGYGARSK